MDENEHVPLSVDPSDAGLRVHVQNGGSGGTAATDEATWTAGVSTFTPAGGAFNDSAAALTSGQQGTARSTANRAIHVNIRKADGTELGILATPVRTDPTGTTTQPISSASTLACGGPSGSGATLVASPLTVGGLAKTALPTAVSDAQVVNAMFDKYGRAVVIPQAPRDLIGTQLTTITASTSETTVVTAAASIFADIAMVTVSNTSATAARVDFRDTTGGSVIFPVYCPAGQTTGFVPHVPIPQTSVNTNWTAQSSASVTDLRVFVQFVKNR